VSQADTIVEPQARESLETLLAEHGTEVVLRTMAAILDISTMPDDIEGRKIADQDIEILEGASQMIENGVPIAAVNPCAGIFLDLVLDLIENKVGVGFLDWTPSDDPLAKLAYWAFQAREGTLEQCPADGNTE